MLRLIVPPKLGHVAAEVRQLTAHVVNLIVVSISEMVIRESVANVVPSNRSGPPRMTNASQRR